jgi:TrmH family RNA methyltransferase
VTETAFTITSTRNRHVVEARKLEQRKHRQRQNQFLVEGVSLLHMALDAGARPVKVFACQETFSGEQARLLARFRGSGAQIVTVSAQVMQALCEREAIEGIVATFQLLETSPDKLNLPEPALVVVLDRLQDPGNVGTLIRTADAVAASAVVLIEPCADPFDRKTVRGSMGSLFNVPLVRVTDPEPLFARLQQGGLRIVGTHVRGGIAWGQGILKGSVALILGNEAHGQSDEVSAFVEANVTLPIVGKAESLNVAVAGGVLMYGWLRENEG